MDAGQMETGIGVEYPRWQKNNAEHALKTRRVVLLSGPRQCGKTTLAKKLNFPEEITYRTLDNENMRKSAILDPYGFLKHKANVFIIDEVQRAPELLSAIKMIVDEDPRPGQFLLTGSANIQSLPTVYESLAGRITKIRLRPLTQGEITFKTPRFFSYAFKQLFEYESEHYDRDAVIDIAFRGGFPEAARLQGQDRAKWHKDYIEAILDRDLHEIVHIQRRESMYDLVEIIAAWSSKLMDISGICSGLSIRRPTVESYINALQALYVVDSVRPWIKTDYDRVGKKSKLFFADTGLMCSILNWSQDQVRLDPDRVGKLIETLVYNELSAQIDASNGEYRLYHYRDRANREIDFLIEREDNAILGIEVKTGLNVNHKDFAHLQWFKDNLAKEKPFIGIVLYSGEFVLPFGPDMWAVPYGKIWPDN